MEVKEEGMHVGSVVVSVPSEMHTGVIVGVAGWNDAGIVYAVRNRRTGLEVEFPESLLKLADL